MPENTTTKISSLELESLTMSNNKVLVEISETNEGRTTKGGIIVGHNRDKIYAEGTDSHAANQADIVGTIHSVPKTLFFSRGHEDSMPWKTIIEVLVGDTVVFDYLDGLNCDEIIVDGRLFKILDYSALYVAVRDSDIIPLNGYNLLLPCLKGRLSDFDIFYRGRENFTRATVKHIARPNGEYDDIGKSDDIDLRVGDTVVFTDHYAKNHIYAERFKEYISLDAQYLICQRVNIIAVL